jgi:hypothetical protein
MASASLRSAVLADGREGRVGVNVRALIDKILARYASANAIYRELLQNSNDAAASKAEIHFRTKSASSGTPVRVVEEIEYRNDGLPFTATDWDRLTCIASGNPNSEKIGAFGVGAYSLFSICEEPMVLSGNSALVFAWDGDELLTRVGPRPVDRAVPSSWTCFVLPARDEAPVPNLDELGAFLASSLTFTDSLRSVSVFIDDARALSIAKSTAQPVTMVPPAANTFWNRNVIALSSPSTLFTLSAHDGSLTDTELRVHASVGSASADVSARIISARVVATVPYRVAAGMLRVMKKTPPAELTIHMIIPDAEESERPVIDSGGGDAASARAVLESFAPRLGNGKVFIGFQTSQTTGLACHVALPVIPTVEREAIDLESPSLLLWNSDLLWMAGAVMRLALEHRMQRVSEIWAEETPARDNAESARLQRIAELLKKIGSDVSGTCEGLMDGSIATSPSFSPTAEDAAPSSTAAGATASSGKGGGFMSGFASFMGAAAGEVRRIATIVATTGGDDDSELLNPMDTEPVSRAERCAIVLMKTFSPSRSSPSPRVGAYIAQGFSGVLPKLSPPVLSRIGIVRGVDALAPHFGIEAFARKTGLVRAVVLGNAESYIENVAQVRRISLTDLSIDLSSRAMSEDELLAFLVWFTAFLRKQPQELAHIPLLKRSITVKLRESPTVVRLHAFSHVALPKTLPRNVPLPSSTLPVAVTARIPSRVLRDQSFSAWFAPLTREAWALFVAEDCSLTAPRSPAADALRIRVISGLADMHAKQMRLGLDFGQLWTRLRSRPFLPVDFRDDTLACPEDLYLNSAELRAFSGSSNMTFIDKKVLSAPNVSKAFMVALGVRQTVSLDVLLTELDAMKWNTDPTGLVRYLASVSDKLSSAEWERLRQTKFLPRAGSGDQHQLYAPSELCLPLPDLRDVHDYIPVLLWKGHFNARGAESQMLTNFLSVKQAPSLTDLLQFAASEATSSNARHRCLMLAFDRLTNEPSASSLRAEMNGLTHVKCFPAQRVDPLLLFKSATSSLDPASSASLSSRLCSMVEAFTDQHASVLGVWIVDDKYSNVANAVGVSREPTARQCVSLLLQLSQTIKSDRSMSGSDKFDVMNKLFGYMSRRASSIEQAECEMLQSASFIPVLVADELVWRKPRDVYFAKPGSRSDSQNVVVSMFDFVPEESVFLRVAGVAEEPSVTDICRRLLAAPDAVYLNCGSASYLELLKLIASQFATLPSALQRNIASSKFVLATQLSDQNSSPGDTGENPNGVRLGEEQSVQQIQFSLARARDVLIVDDSFLQRMFNPLCAPSDTTIESFYERLGSVHLSSATRKQYHLFGGDTTEESTETRALRDRIVQRRSLVLDAVPSHSLRPNASQLLEKLDVLQVQGIQARYTLKSVTRSIKVSCCAHKDNNALLVTNSFDFFDVAEAMGNMLYTKASLQDRFLTATLLETSLPQLRARGFPVDKLVSTAPSPTPASNSRLRGEQAPPSAPPEPRQPSGAQSQEPLTNVQHQSASRSPAPNGSATGLSEILCAMFHDADPAWIFAEVSKDPTDQGLRNIKARMERGEYLKKQTSHVAPGRSRSSSVSSSYSGLPSRKGFGLKGAFKSLKGLAGALSPKSGHGSACEPPPIKRRAGDSTLGGLGLRTQMGAASDPRRDKENKNAMKSVLDRAIRSSQHVPVEGVSNPTTNVTPSDADAAATKNGMTCDVIPGHDLQSVDGRRTSDGLVVFGSRLDRNDSVAYCRENWLAVEEFGAVLADIGRVFAIDLRCMGIYMSESGESIAFNANRRLHFNLRFFMTLHRDAVDSRAYFYWWTTTAHELAHNLQSGHNQLHQAYFENFLTEFHPRFLSLLLEKNLHL